MAVLLRFVVPVLLHGFSSTPSAGAELHCAAGDALSQDVATVDVALKERQVLPSSSDCAALG